MKYNNVKVSSVRFQSDAFCIFVGLVNGKKQTFTGNVFVSKGEKLDIEGELFNHPRYGEQIKISSYSKREDIDSCDLKEYLKTFKGIGDVKAQKIIDELGDNCIEIIKKDYTKLVLLGIKEPIAKNIHSALCKNKVLNEVVKLLNPYGVSLNTINKMYNKYNDNILDILKYNPYKVKEHVNIGFDVLDQFSLKNNIPFNGVSRIIAGIKEAMSFYIAFGHSFAYVSDIIDRVMTKLNKNARKEVEKADIIKVLLYMEEEKELIILEDSSVYLPYLYYAERNIARKILKMNKVSSSNIKDFDELIKRVEGEIKINYSPNQQDAIKTALLNNISIITGGPGTGKTTTLNGVIHALKMNNSEIKLALAAPTGKAAKRMEESTGIPAKTIHRLLEYKPYDGELLCGRNEENPLDVDVIVIDESSMLDLTLMDKFLKAIKEETKLIIVGDVDQLPSVGAGNVLKDLIKSNIIPVVRLETIFRQQGTSTIVTNAYNINHGLGLNLENEDFQMIEINDEDTVVAKEIVKEFVRLKNEEGLSLDDIQVLCPMRKRDNLCSSTVLNKMIQNAINPKKQGSLEVSYNGITYREGDKVLQLKNNYEKECFNGDIGYITSIKKVAGEISLTVKFDTEEEITFSGREEILELELAYAMSVHKSQGSEYKTVLMPMVESQKVMLTRNLFYTGVTRAKKNVKLFGSKSAISMAIKNVDNTKRNSKLAEYIKNTTIKFN